LAKDLSHLSISFSRPEKNLIAIELHHGGRKSIAALRTVRTLISNLIIGVTRGFLYKMRYVYAHFPIKVNAEENKETGLYEIEIRYGSTSIFIFNSLRETSLDACGTDGVNGRYAGKSWNIRTPSQSILDLL
jgi:large subunit ribosomal protein L9e